MKKGFANHLYRTLENYGISSFLDMKELPDGEDVRPHMPVAAGRALVGVPIFTKIYGKSHWCLDELVAMIESKRGKVVPVFYDVKPEDLRMQSGEFARNFEDHLLSCKHEAVRIQQWKVALENASWLAGLWLEEYDVKGIWSMLS